MKYQIGDVNASATIQVQPTNDHLENTINIHVLKVVSYPINRGSEVNSILYRSHLCRALRLSRDISDLRPDQTSHDNKRIELEITESLAFQCNECFEFLW